MRARVRPPILPRRRLITRLWEGLWEDDVPEYGGDKLDITSLFQFTSAGLLFADRLFSAAGVNESRFEIGVVSPFGRVLTVAARYEGLWRAYRATSGVDLWIARDVDTGAAGDATQRGQIVAESWVNFSTTGASVSNRMASRRSWQREKRVSHKALGNAATFSHVAS